MKYYVDVKSMINDIQKGSEKALLYCGEYLASKIQEEVSIDSYDTGQLARSITYVKDEDGVLVGTNLEYALVREYGRRPGKFPPLDALVGWTARHGMISGGVTERYDNLHYKDKGVVFIVARAIATRGIEGKHTFENVYKREEQNIINLYQELIDQGL